MFNIIKISTFLLFLTTIISSCDSGEKTNQQDKISNNGKTTAKNGKGLTDTIYFECL